MMPEGIHGDESLLAELPFILRFLWRNARKISISIKYPTRCLLLFDPRKLLKSTFRASLRSYRELRLLLYLLRMMIQERALH